MLQWHRHLRCAHLCANSRDYYVTVQRGLLPAVVAQLEPVREEEVAFESIAPLGGAQGFFPPDNGLKALMEDACKDPPNGI